MNVFQPCIRCLLFIGLFFQFAAHVWAQNYPVRMVRYIVPFSSGGGSDTLNRIIAGGLTQALGQQVIVDNRPGAASNIGAEIAAKAPPDGYTLLAANTSHAANVTLYRKLAYDLLRDFDPVTQLAMAPFAVVVHRSLPVTSIKELVRLARARPGAIDYASAGLGTPSFLGAELFKAQAGVDMVHVPYKAGSMALNSVISGETSVSFIPFPVALPFIKEGRLRSIALTSAKRVAVLPDYPTVAESGYPGYAFGSWHGLLVPAKTPRDIIAKIRMATISVLEDPNIKKRMANLGYISVGDQPEEFAAFIRAEIKRLGDILLKFGVKAD